MLNNKFLTLISLISLLLISFYNDIQCSGSQIKNENKENMNLNEKNDLKFHTKTLSNGMTIYICQTNSFEVYSVLLFHVGSSSECSSEKGLAHFLEHMMFKGMERKNKDGSSIIVSESDINSIVSKLSGYCNAFTSYDYTGYIFKIPSHNWAEILPIYSLWMNDCVFKQEHINSEVKAVIQEMKLYKDNYSRTLTDVLISAIFQSHPYENPIIGYKHDLWNMTRENMMNFYKKYYVPANSSFFIVGNVDPEAIFKQIEAEFSKIKVDSSKNIKNIVSFPVNHDIKSNNTILRRDVIQPIVTLAFQVPGLRDIKNSLILFQLCANALFNGKASRLYKKLVDEQKLVSEISAKLETLLDGSVFLIEFIPYKIESIEKIKKIIFDEFALVSIDGFDEAELSGEIKRFKLHFEASLEENESIFFEMLNSILMNLPVDGFLKLNREFDLDLVNSGIKELITSYFREDKVYSAAVLPLGDEFNKQELLRLQNQSDLMDSKILAGKERFSEFEPEIYSKNIVAKKLDAFKFPEARILKLANGLKLILYKVEKSDIVNCALNFKVNSFYDADGLEGVAYICSQLLLEGTKKYEGASFVEQLKNLGIDFHSSPDGIEFIALKDNLIEALKLLFEMLKNPMLSESSFEKIRNKTKSKLNDFWDNPKSFAKQISRSIIYSKHPYSKFVLGTKDSLENISHSDVCAFYSNYISPVDAQCVLVGNFNDVDIAEIESIASSWGGKAVENLVYPNLNAVIKDNYTYEINRDQTVLVFAGLSISQFDSNYDSILIFDQILTASLNISIMNSKLFQVREATGLFYTYGGSLLCDSNTKQPGFIYISVVVSKDRLEEAKKVIKDVILNSVDTVTEAEFESAKEAIKTALISKFDKNYKILHYFSFLDKYNLSADYYNKRLIELENIKLIDMQIAVKNLLKNNLFCITVGR